MDMKLSAIALGGLDDAQTKLEQAAVRLSSIGQNSPDGTLADTVDLSTEMVNLLSARNQFSVNINVLKTADEIDRETLNILA